MILGIGVVGPLIGNSTYDLFEFEVKLSENGGASGRGGSENECFHRYLLSSKRVTGPSLQMLTSILAPKRPP